MTILIRMPRTHDENLLQSALAALETGPAACLVLDPLGPTVVAANAAAELLYGYARGAMRGLPLSALSESRPDLLRARTLETLALGATTTLAAHRRSDGSTIQVSIQAFRSIPNGEPLVLGMVTPLGDAPPPLDANERAPETAPDMLFRAITEHSSDLICLHRPNGTYLYVSPSSRRLLGYEPEELVGKNPYDFFHPEDAETIRNGAHELALSGRVDPRIEYRFRGKSGAWIWLQTLTMPIAGPDGKPYLLETTSRDVTDLKAKEDEIRALAFHDQLTGLPNRRLLQDRIERSIAAAARSGETLCVGFLDLDGFKLINDTHGHALGDQVLVRTAERLRACMRQADTAARMGGDEFVAVMVGLSKPEDADQATRRIVDLVGSPMILDGIACQVGVSIGLAFYPDDGCDAETLMRRADIALYAAKDAGKGRAMRFEDVPAVERNRYECPDPHPEP